MRHLHIVRLLLEYTVEVDVGNGMVRRHWVCHRAWGKLTSYTSLSSSVVQISMSKIILVELHCMSTSMHFETPSNREKTLLRMPFTGLILNPIFWGGVGYART